MEQKDIFARCAFFQSGFHSSPNCWLRHKLDIRFEKEQGVILMGMCLLTAKPLKSRIRQMLHFLI